METNNEYHLTEDEHLAYLLAISKVKNLQIQYAPIIQQFDLANQVVQEIVKQALARLEIVDSQISLDEDTGKIEIKG